MQYNLPRCVVILTAIPEETRAVLSYSEDVWKQTIHPGTIYRISTFNGKTSRWKIVVVQAQAGNAHAAEETVRAIENFHPDILMFIGVAGGLKKELKLGDVVASTKVYSYEYGKAEKCFKVRPEVANSDYSLIQKASDLVVDKFWQNRIPSKLPTNDIPIAFIKPIAAGEKIVASTRSSTYKFLQKQYSDAYAVEMEGYGILKAAHSYPEVSAIVIRGISDLIQDKEKSDMAGWQDIASLHAAAFGFELLNELESVKLQEKMPWFLSSEELKIDEIVMLDFVKHANTINKIWDIVDYLIKTVELRPDPNERYWTYITLGKISFKGYRLAEDALLKGLKDSDKFACQGAREGLKLLRAGKDYDYV